MLNTKCVILTNAIANNIIKFHSVQPGELINFQQLNQKHSLKSSDQKRNQLYVQIWF